MEQDTPDFGDLFDEVIAPYQVADFKRECDVFHDTDPRDYFKLLGKHAKQMILAEEGYLERAVFNYYERIELERKERRLERELRKVGKSGRPITTQRSIGRGTRRRVYKRDNFECVYCGVKVILDYELSDTEKGDRPDTASIDHLIPGNTDFENLVTACISCNSAKSNRTPEQASMPAKFGRFAHSD